MKKKHTLEVVSMYQMIISRDKGQLADIDSRTSLLRTRLQSIFCDKTEGAKDPYDYLDGKTGIGESLFRKVFNGKRNITRNMLARFVIGLKLNREQADELFGLLGAPLNQDNKLDFVIINAIRDGDEIDDFVTEVEEYTGYKI